MTGEEIYDVANHAVNTVMRRTSCWWDEDREDARQEAALAVLLASRRGLDKDRGYYFGAARKGAYLWIRLWMRPKRNAWPLLDAAEELVAADTVMADAMYRHLEELAPLLRGQRTRNRKTTEDEIALEVAWVRLMVEGYSIQEAGEKLGRTQRNAEALRERVVPRLQAIADGKRAEIKPVKVNPASLEALRRNNADPEICRRRGLTCSVTKRRENAVKRALRAGHRTPLRDARDSRPGAGG